MKEKECSISFGIDGRPPGGAVEAIRADLAKVQWRWVATFTISANGAASTIRNVQKITNAMRRLSRSIRKRYGVDFRHAWFPVCSLGPLRARVLLAGEVDKSELGKLAEEAGLSYVGDADEHIRPVRKTQPARWFLNYIMCDLIVPDPKALWNSPGAIYTCGIA